MLLGFVFTTTLLVLLELLLTLLAGIYTIFSIFMCLFLIFSIYFIWCILLISIFILLFTIVIVVISSISCVVRIVTVCLICVTIFVEVVFVLVVSPLLRLIILKPCVEFRVITTFASIDSSAVVLFTRLINDYSGVLIVKLLLLVLLIPINILRHEILRIWLKICGIYV